MLQGFYNATSGAITQNRKLNVIGNNMANVSTPGFKTDQAIEQSFEEILAYRAYNKAMVDAVAVGDVGRGVMVERNYTNFSQGAVLSTNRSLDFAILGNGFFTIAGQNGNVYTRGGQFSLDEAGFLTLQGIGNVLGTDGAPIFVGTDKISADNLGNIFNDTTNEYLGSIQVVDFADYDSDLVKSDGNTFVASVAPQQVQTEILNGALEQSNAEAVDGMTDMMQAQRALQSNTQIMQMYDELMSKIVSQLGPR